MTIIKNRIIVFLALIVFLYGVVIAICYRSPGIMLHDAIKHNDFNTFSRLLTDRNANTLNVWSNDKATYLINDACSWARPRFVTLLLAKGANVHVRDSHGRTCLSSAIGGTSSDAAIDVLNVLVKHDSTLLATKDPGNGDTSLHYAVRICCDIRVIEALIRLGADTDAKNNDGLTPSELCEKRGCHNRSDVVALFEAIRDEK